jgi:hypothetical protein
MSTVTLYPTEDCHVYDNDPDTNLDNQTNLRIGDVHGEYRSWVKFDLTSIPYDATIVSATFFVSAWLTAYSYSQIFSISSCSDSSWSESKITWNNAPEGSVSGIPAATFTAGGPQNLDVTYDVGNEVINGVISFRLSSATLDGSEIIMYDKESGLQTIQLDVVYTTASPPSNTTSMMFMFA